MGTTKSKESSNRNHSIDIDTTLAFTEFVKDSKNYEIFISYLSHRQSIENILFLERVTAIYQIIYKYKTLYEASRTDGEASRNDKYPCGLAEILQLKYLRDIYNEYEHTIHVLNNNSSGSPSQRYEAYDIRHFNDAFYTIYTQIYNEFIEDDACHQINISYETRQSLYAMLNQHKLSSFDDYLHFFDEANYEIYKLLTSTYDHGFEQYISRHLSENQLRN